MLASAAGPSTGTCHADTVISSEPGEVFALGGDEVNIWTFKYSKLNQNPSPVFYEGYTVVLPLLEGLSSTDPRVLAAIAGIVLIAHIAIDWARSGEDEFGEGEGVLVLHDLSKTPLLALPPCRMMANSRLLETAGLHAPQGSKTAVCTLVDLDRGATELPRLQADPLDGDDIVKLDLTGVDLLSEKDIDGGLGNDRIRGSRFADFLNGGVGDDLILGGPGNDVITGETPDVSRGIPPEDLEQVGFTYRDRLFGEEGNDIVLGQDGSDLVSGGDDNDDRFSFRKLGQIDDGQLTDDYRSNFIIGGSLDGGYGVDTVVGGDGRDSMQGGPGPDAILASEVDLGHSDEVEDLESDCGGTGVTDAYANESYRASEELDPSHPLGFRAIDPVGTCPRRIPNPVTEAQLKAWLPGERFPWMPMYDNSM